MCFSCIKQELNEYCPKDIRVYFSYLDNKGNTRQRGINPADVDRIHLYVYDEKGCLHTEYIDENPTLSPDYYITLSLQPGAYRLLAWGGDDPQDYSISLETREEDINLNDEVLFLTRSMDNEISRIQHHLFYAGPKYNAVVEKQDERFVLPVIQDTYTINVSLDCYEYPANSLEVRVWDDNGSYGFDNSFFSDSLCYNQSFITNGLNQYNASIRLMRLAEYRNPTMILYDVTQGKSLLEVKLVKLLINMYEKGLIDELDFEHLYEYDVPFTLCPNANDGKIGVLIDMDAWHLEIDGIILDADNY